MNQCVTIVPSMFQLHPPQKKNMEPENGPLEKEIPNLDTKRFPGSMLNLGGCTVSIAKFLPSSVFVGIAWRRRMSGAIIATRDHLQQPIFFGNNCCNGVKKVGITRHLQISAGFSGF